MINLKKWLIGLLVISCAFTGLLWLLGLPDERLPAQELRAGREGLRLVTLPDGVTRFQIEGPEDGPLLVLIHGGREPAWTWNEVLPILHASGIRTLRYDMYGRGYSDRPSHTVYNQALYLRQVNDLLDALDIGEPIHIAGYSFGATVAASLANQRVNEVQSLTVLAPRYFAIEVPAVARIPLLNSALVKYVVKPQALDEVRQFFNTPELKEQYAYKVGEPKAVVGNQQAFLSFLLSDALSSTDRIYQRFEQTKIPLLIFSGENDTGIPLEHIEGIMSQVPRAVHVRMRDVDHGLVWQKGREIAVRIVKQVLEKP